MILENNRPIAFTGFVGRKWFTILGVAGFVLGDFVAFCFQHFSIPLIYVVPFMIAAFLFASGLAFRRGVDIFGEGRKWPAIALTISIFIPIVNLAASGFCLWKAGRLSASSSERPTAYTALAFTIIFGVVLLGHKEKALTRSTSTNDCSMLPTLNCHDKIRFDPAAYEGTSPKRGDIILYKTAGQREAAKRVVGVAGDKVQFSGHEIKINGESLPQKIAPDSSRLLGSMDLKEIAQGGTAQREDYEILSERQGDSNHLILQMKQNPTSEFLSGEVDIKPGTVFVVGDHREASIDSRVSGAVNESSILGRVETDK